MCSLGIVLVFSRLEGGLERRPLEVAVVTLPELAAGGTVKPFDAADDSDAAMPPNDRATAIGRS